MSISYDKEAKLEIESTERDFIQLNKSGTEVFKIDADGYTYSNTLTANSEHAVSYGSVFADKSTGKLYLQDGAGFSGLTAYVPTLADAENTADKVAIVTFTIPANTMQDGEFIECKISLNAYNLSGSTQNCNIYSDVNNDEQFAFANSMENVDLEGIKVFFFGYLRKGTNFYMYNKAGADNSTYGSAYRGLNATSSWDDALAGGTATHSTIDYTNDLTVKLVAKFAVANASLYLRPSNCTIHKYNLLS